VAGVRLPQELSSHTPLNALDREVEHGLTNPGNCVTHRNLPRRPALLSLRS